MGLFGKKQEAGGQKDSLLQRIEFLPSDAARDEWLMYLYPKTDINSKSILYINPGQVAIAVHAGKIEHVFAGDSGNTTLTTDNYPFLKKFVGKVYGDVVPYDMKIYFINATGFKTFKWGTPSPITVPFTDPDTRQKFRFKVQANGDYKVRVQFYQYFLDTVAGSIAPGSWVTWDEMREKLKSFMNQHILKCLDDEIRVATAQGLFDPLNPKSIIGIAPKIRAKLNEKDENGNPSQLEMLGLELTGFNINDVLVPEEEVQKYEKAISEYNADIAISNVNINNRLAKEQMRALNTAAGNEGQVGGMMGAGLGFGYGMGMMNQAANMQPGMQAVNNVQQQNQQQAVKIRCPKCNALCDETAKFCLTCGNPLAAPGSVCPKCGQPVAPGAKFCGSCGQSLGPKTCPKCGQELAPGAKFCGVCGTKVEE